MTLRCNMIFKKCHNFEIKSKHCDKTATAALHGHAELTVWRDEAFSEERVQEVPHWGGCLSSFTKRATFERAFPLRMGGNLDGPLRTPDKYRASGGEQACRAIIFRYLTTT